MTGLMWRHCDVITYYYLLAISHTAPVFSPWSKTNKRDLVYPPIILLPYFDRTHIRLNIIPNENNLTFKTDRKNPQKPVVPNIIKLIIINNINLPRTWLWCNMPDYYWSSYSFLLFTCRCPNLHPGRLRSDEKEAGGRQMRQWVGLIGHLVGQVGQWDRLGNGEEGKWVWLDR
jgi:hypothetical protein